MPPPVLCRHLSYAAQLAEALASVRATPLANMTKVQRAIFFQLLRQAREEAKLITDLSDQASSRPAGDHPRP
jgi:hypothetical protein